MADKKAKKDDQCQRGFSSWSAGKKIAVAAGGILGVLVIACVVIVASKLSKIDQQILDSKKLNISQEAQNEAQSKKGYLNVALFGVDSRDNKLGKGTRSDTIMVASLNRETKEVKIASVYRDTLLEQEDGTLNKANAAYSYGGPEEAVAMLNKNLDLNIQHYVTVNFNALIDVIDAVGGVEIDVQEDEVEYITGYATEILNVTGRESDGIYGPGPQTLNGVLATAYARIRYTKGDDFKRTERQRAVLEQIIKKAQASDISTINKIIDKIFPEISTNFKLTEIITYAKDAMKYKLGGTIGFPKDNTTDSISGVGSIVIPETLSSNVIELHKFLLGTKDYTVSSKITKIEKEIKDKCAKGDWSGYENHDYDGGESYYNSNTGDGSSESDPSYSSKALPDDNSDSGGSDPDSGDSSSDNVSGYGSITGNDNSYSDNGYNDSSYNDGSVNDSSYNDNSYNDNSDDDNSYSGSENGYSGGNYDDSSYNDNSDAGSSPDADISYDNPSDAESGNDGTQTDDLPDVQEDNNGSGQTEQGGTDSYEDEES